MTTFSSRLQSRFEESPAQVAAHLQQAGLLERELADRTRT
jgi:hypothetical protein